MVTLFSMPSFVVLSKSHDLLPLANRIASAGADVVAGTHWATARDRVWRCPVAGEVEVLAAAKEALTSGDATLVTSSPFHAPGVYPSHYHTEESHEGPLYFGTWNHGDRHFVFEVRGTYPGGGGPQVVAGAVLVRVESDLPLDPPRGVGLTRAPLSFPEGTATLGEPETGWFPFHWHAAFHGLTTAGTVEALVGTAPLALDRFTVVGAVSLPPWPLTSRRGDRVPLGELPEAVMESAFWHDVAVVDGALVAGGVGGLVAVARGSGPTLGVANARYQQTAAAIAQALGPSAQWRPDLVAGPAQALDGLALLGWSPF